MANITAFADHTGGETLVTSTTHGIAATDVPVIQITGTQMFNGIFEATYHDADSFLITSTYALAISKAASATVTTTNTSLTDTRLSMVTDAYVGCVLTCDGKTMTVTANTATAFSGTAWSGGGNPGDGDAWTLKDAAGTWERAVYVSNYPLSSTDMSSSTEQVRANWEIIEDWWATEHGGIASATSGAHAIGRTGAMLTGTTATITGLSSPGTGALALNTTVGEMELYRWDSVNSSAGWDGITDIYFSRLKDGFGAQDIAVGASAQLVAAPTGLSGTYDGLSEWASYKFTVRGAGYYLISVKLVWPATSSEYSKGMAIYKNGSAICRKGLYGSAILTMELNDVPLLAATDYIQVYAWHGHGVAVEIMGTIYISRVS